MPTIRFCGLKENDFIPGQLGEEEADDFLAIYSEDSLDLADNIDRTCLPLWPVAVVCAAIAAAVAWMMT